MTGNGIIELVVFIVDGEDFEASIVIRIMSVRIKFIVFTIIGGIVVTIVDIVAVALTTVTVVGEDI